ncbi:LexA family protein [Streptomyces kronopolitis]
MLEGDGGREARADVSPPVARAACTRSGSGTRPLKSTASSGAGLTSRGRPRRPSCWERRCTRLTPDELTDEAGYPPSIREVAEKVALSASTVAYHLQVLERRGIVTHAPHRSRSYQVRL